MDYQDVFQVENKYDIKKGDHNQYINSVREEKGIGEREEDNSGRFF
jgi:hypothetical protein